MKTSDTINRLQKKEWIQLQLDWGGVAVMIEETTSMQKVAPHVKHVMHIDTISAHTSPSMQAHLHVGRQRRVDGRNDQFGRLAAQRAHALLENLLGRLNLLLRNSTGGERRGREASKMEKKKEKSHEIQNQKTKNNE